MQFPRGRSRTPPPAMNGHPQQGGWQPVNWPALRGSASSQPLPLPSSITSSGLPALRRGGPERLPYGRGVMPDLSSESERREALQSLEDGFYAASSLSAVRSRRRCYTLLLQKWGSTPLPLTEVKLRQLGAGLKAGRYRSSANVLSQIKVDAERAGQTIDGHLARLMADISRSCLRGMGPPVRALPLPFSRLHELPGLPAPWVRGGPLGPRNSIIIGSWWMLRESELANARAALVELSGSRAPVATLVFPASKSDATAQGLRRTHACICTGRPYRVDCPAHAVWDQLLLLRAHFPQCFAEGRPHMSLPLFPGVCGRPVSKESVVQMITVAAATLGVPRASADGSMRLSGHTLRTTGAQGLTALGLDTWAVQLVGRWGSSVVAQYTREAAVGPQAAVARSRLIAGSLRHLAANAAADLSEEELRRVASEEVNRAFGEWAPQLAAAIKTSLVPDLLREVARRRVAEGSSSTSSASSSPTSAPSGSPIAAPELDVEPESFETTVTSLKTGRKHRILIGPEATMSQDSWVTWCGWKFGSAGCTRDSLESDSLCRRCFPEQRGA